MKNVKNFIISGTNFWNPGDDWVRDGVVELLKKLFPEFLLNFHFYNFNQDFFPQSKFSGIANTVSLHDLEKCRDFVDAIIIAGLSAGTEVKDLYSWIINNGLHDRVYLIGAGYENDYVARHVTQEPEATIFKSARVITGRTRKTPELMQRLGLPYHHINCPAILSVPKEKEIPKGKQIERIGFSIQLPHNVGVVNHCCSPSMYRLALHALMELAKSYVVEIVAHHKTEYFHFLPLMAPLGVNVIYSSFYQNLYEVYPRYDLVITTRLHSSLFANGHGIPGIIINDTDRHTHCLDGFPHSVWVSTPESLSRALQSIQTQELKEISLEARAFKERLMNRYLEVLRPAFRLDCRPAQVEAAGAGAREEPDLPAHFFTIVLNGEPFIRHHIEVLQNLPFAWHWHIVEGVADLNNDTAWSLANGGRILESLHDNGLSNDGTSAYLDSLALAHPDKISIYRKPPGIFWDGKLEMVNAPLQCISGECLLWQIDVDELWTAEQIGTARQLFLEDPSRTAAFYFCNFYVGPGLVISTRNTYGNHPEYEWLRTWRYRPGDRWVSHEPPRLCRADGSGIWRNLADIYPFRHEETEARQLVFDHHAYVIEKQLRFKEIYYGYRNAVERWRRLQAVERFPVPLREYFPWVQDHAQVVQATPSSRIGDQSADHSVQRLLWLRPDSIGDGVLAASMLPYLKQRYPDATITVFCQQHVAEFYEASPLVHSVIGFDLLKASENEQYRDMVLQRLQGVKADLLLNSLYSRAPLYDYFSVMSGAKETVACLGDLSNTTAEQREHFNRAYRRVLPSEPELRPELERHRHFLKGLGIAAEPLAPLFWTTPADEDFASAFFADHGLAPDRCIALFAGANSRHRIYAHYGTALAAICKEGNYTVLALGAAYDHSLNQQNLDDCGAPSINLSGKLTLRQTAAILKRCRIAVGAETGTAHIACAVGTPNVVLVGGGHFGRFMPYSPLTSVVCLPLSCYFCNWSCTNKQALCVKALHPEVMAYAVRETLKGTPESIRIFCQPESLWRPLTNEPRWQWRGELVGSYPYQLVEVPVAEAGAAGPPDLSWEPMPGGGRLPDQQATQQQEGCGDTLAAVRRETEGATLPGAGGGRRYVVSAIVSTYNAERLMRGKLEDLEAQTIAQELEIIVVDSGSQQNERGIVEEFQRRYDNIRYIRTERRETVYQAWNRGVRAARGEFITNANTDDRLRRDCLEILVRALRERRDCVLAYGDMRISNEENGTFEKHQPYGYRDWPPFDRFSLLELCCIGPFPLWRRSLHEDIGYFDERYRSAGDYEFWLRAALKHEFVHVPQFLGLYYLSPETVSRKGDLPNVEYLQVQHEYRSKYAKLAPAAVELTVEEESAYQAMLASSPEGSPDRVAKLQRFAEQHPKSAQAHHDLAELCYKTGDLGHARKYFEKAALLDLHSPRHTGMLQSFLKAELYQSLQHYNNPSASGDELERQLILGMICTILERLDAARSCYLRALEIDPCDGPARANLAYLEPRLANSSSSASTVIAGLAEGGGGGYCHAV